MKVFISSLFAVLLASKASAVIVSVSTGQFAGAVSDVSNTPIPFGTGFIQVGVIDSAFDGLISTSTAEVINSNFTPFTGSVGTFGQSAGASNFDGFVNFATSGLRVSGGDAFFGNNIYVLLGNGGSLLESSNLAVFKTAELFPDDSAAAVDATPTLNLLTTDGTWLMGGPSGGQTSTGGFEVPNAATMAVVVPEPSIAILGLLGMIGLVRRRR